MSGWGVRGGNWTSGLVMFADGTLPTLTGCDVPAPEVEPLARPSRFDAWSMTGHPALRALRM
jgi:hypothetical protein